MAEGNLELQNLGHNSEASLLGNYWSMQSWPVPTQHGGGVPSRPEKISLVSFGNMQPDQEALWSPKSSHEVTHQSGITWMPFLFWDSAQAKKAVPLLLLPNKAAAGPLEFAIHAFCGGEIGKEHRSDFPQSVLSL